MLNDFFLTKDQMNLERYKGNSARLVSHIDGEFLFWRGNTIVRLSEYEDQHHSGGENCWCG